MTAPLPPAVVAATGFMTALDANDVDALWTWVHEDATWWVDTGPDRAAGVDGNDPGAARGFPLHATMPAAEKLESLRGLPSRWPQGIRQKARLAFGDDEWALVEVEGYGVHARGVVYENRYGFVIGSRDGKVHTIREYLDTLHAASVFGALGKVPRSIAVPPTPPAVPVVARDEAQAAVLAVVAAVDAGDVDALGALFAPDGVWWADTGLDRVAGRFDVDPGPERPWPLHGRLPIAEKVASMQGFQARWRDGLHLTAKRCFSQDRYAACELASQGVHANGRVYQNRYVFVVALDDGGRIAWLHEFCDTYHIADLFGLVPPPAEA